ncbi:protein of unknown function [Oenococcus oeni]|uniref:Uncharacterized protein n=1 Tax=Oenococcus oeni TaxID=1247 RepID=A0AAQ2UUY4_OENOE|nr:hypothetical protein [Oenococcus oeni]SYW05241.1 hypothetical protein OENI_120011 [Oenococcus oeni]VDB98802.1 protein of unknown function [Oenococcus oeni]
MEKRESGKKLWIWFFAAIIFFAAIYVVWSILNATEIKTEKITGLNGQTKVVQINENTRKWTENNYNSLSMANVTDLLFGGSSSYETYGDIVKRFGKPADSESMETDGMKAKEGVWVNVDSDLGDQVDLTFVDVKGNSDVDNYVLIAKKQADQ